MPSSLGVGVRAQIADATATTEVRTPITCCLFSVMNVIMSFIIIIG